MLQAAEANAAGTLAVATADLMQDKIHEMDKKANQAREALDQTLAELNQEKEKGSQDHAVCVWNKCHNFTYTL